MSAAPSEDPRPHLPFRLPSHDGGRETLHGWRHWREHREMFTPAPVISWEAYQALSPRRRRLHDLHRAATHANLVVQETPMSEKVTRVLRKRLESGTLKHRPSTRPGVMISGGGYQGKTETVAEFAAAFEDDWFELHRYFHPDSIPGTRDVSAPVAYVPTPVKATPLNTCRAILNFFGGPVDMTYAQALNAVRSSFRDHGTRLLIMDDITRLKLHRESDQDVLDMIRDLMSMQVTVVLIGVGIRKSGLLREGTFDPRTGQWVMKPPAKPGKSYNDEAATQTERRFDLLDLDPFRYDTAEDMAAFIRHLNGIESQLRLFRAGPGMLTDGVMPEYIHHRTNGVVGLVERLIEDVCQEAIATGLERIDEKLMAGIEINLGNLPDRDAEAGEVPEIPPAAPAPTSRRPPKKRRNTVFDDPGLPPNQAEAG